MSVQQVEGVQPGRRVTTVLFTDIAGSTGLAARMGDRRWADLLARHRDMVRAALVEHSGHEVQTTGDGFLALFDRTGDALACALGAVQSAPELGLTVRAGLHTGECDLDGQSVTGLAVHVAARIVALAEPGEVLVSTTVRDLAASNDFRFTPRGTHSLKGVPRRWRVYAARPVTGESPADPQAPSAPKQRSQPKPAAAPRRRTAALRVLLVDDHPLWRQTLKAVIERGRFAKVVGEAGTGADAFSAASATSPDVVVMDIDMPSVDGVEATRRLVDSGTAARVLMLSSSDERSDVARALRAGASGYLLKTAEGAEIRESIRRIAAGELVFPSDVSSYVLEELRAGHREEPARAALATDQLTRREREILELMAEGCSNHAVAERLHISLKTVEAHTGAIFSKLGVESSPAGHRRVLAVVTYLKSSRGTAGVGEPPGRSRRDCPDA